MKETLRIAGACLIIAAAGVNQCLAADETNVSRGVTTDGVPLAVHGVDTVALSTLNAVAEGNASYSVVFDGAAYYFASEESAKSFKANPAKYAPQYGGYCAYAVALGKKFDGDPRYADIVDGKLYLFVNDKIFAEYKKNKKRTLAKAEKTWPTIKHKAIAEL